jgi:2-polyprenyl-3-methyl-5-hydroxy-6-metoxy-1,4-benzoquinol methylase
MKTLKYLLLAILWGDFLTEGQYTVIKDIYNSYIFGSPLRTMIKKGDKVLELGCGKNSLIVRSGLIKKLSVTGVDIFKPYLELHRSSGLYDNCVLADITKVEFVNNSFDAVVCMDVLEHIDKKEGIELLEKMKRWGEKVIITTPNGYVGWYAADGNIHQNHKSGWFIEDFTSQGYKVRGGSGWKPLRKEDSQLRHRHPFLFWAGLSFLSSFVVYRMPRQAYHLQATYEK